MEQADTQRENTQAPVELAKRNIDDSVFTHLFQQPEYTLQLYQALHPEDTQVTEAEISVVTVENVLLNQPYNDLGFRVGNKLLILVEAQSTWSMNIVVRGLLYMAQTIQNHIQDTGQNIYASKKVAIPEAEFYVLYTGSRKDRPEQITLSQEFFEGRKSALEVTVNMIYDGKSGDIISQYVAFTRIYREKSQEYGRTRKAVLETIKTCQDRNILARYLQSRRKEVINIMMSLFNQEQALETYVREERQKAEQSGLLKGKQEGRTELAQQVALAMYQNNNPIDVIAATVQESVTTVKHWLGLD
jgi:hypothetical protein